MANRQDGWWVMGCARRFSPPLSLSFIEMLVIRFGNDNYRISLSFIDFFCGYRTDYFRVSISNPTVRLFDTAFSATSLD